MCFSAEASFTSAIVLSAIGVLSLIKVSRRDLILLALIPLLFAFQQFVEGLLWLTTNNLENYVRYSALLKNLFLFVAFFIWPIWIPLTLYLPEKDPLQKRLLTVFLGIGVFYVLFVLYGFLQWWTLNDVRINFFEHSIQYQIPEKYSFLFAFLYCAATLLPPFFSSLRGMLALGIANVVGFLVAYYLFYQTFLSVWCFFAALVSLGIYFLIRWNDSSVKTIA